MDRWLRATLDHQRAGLARARYQCGWGVVERYQQQSKLRKTTQELLPRHWLTGVAFASLLISRLRFCFAVHLNSYYDTNTRSSNSGLGTVVSLLCDSK